MTERKVTATEVLKSDWLRMPLRRNRAMSLTAAIMDTVRNKLPPEHDDALEYIHRAVFEALHDLGAEVITDEDRRVAGLPPRNADGLTAEEMLALERRRLELLCQPLSYVIPDPKPELLSVAEERARALRHQLRRQHLRRHESRELVAVDDQRIIEHAITAARNAALEEAAGVADPGDTPPDMAVDDLCDAAAWNRAKRIAAAIRALKTTAP